MHDPTEAPRKERIAEINAGASDREALEAEYGEVWDTSEVSLAFDITGFMAPYVVCKRKSDGVKGSLEFRHSPRFYFNFKEE